MSGNKVRLAVLSTCLDVLFAISWCDASEQSHTERNLREPLNCFSATLKNTGDMKELETTESGLTAHFGHPSSTELTQVYSHYFVSDTSCSCVD